jgi:hypothetical protein
MKSYDTAEYAKSRLVETVIRHGNVPVLVMDVGTVDGKIWVHYNKIMDGDVDMYGDEIDNFNLDPVQLGYVNYKNFAYYLTRMPMRKDWRQGLRLLNVVGPDGDRPPVPLKTIGETIVGNFPSFKSCLDKLNTKKVLKSVAFCRDFSVSTEEIQYKGVFPIGKVDMENGNIHINDGMSWIREALDEALEIAA